MRLHNLSNKEIFLPSGTGVTGLAVSEDNKKALRTVIIAALIVVMGLVGFYFYRRMRKKKGAGFGRQKRMLLDIDF